jgi:hypothetical protein
MPADKPVISRLTASALFETRKRMHVRIRNHRLKIDDATDRPASSRRCAAAC